LDRFVDQPAEIADVSAAQDRPLYFAAEIASGYSPAKSPHREVT
jgi:hypothetical protein